LFSFIQGSNIQSYLCQAATQGKPKKWLLKAGGCLTEVNISTNLTFGNILCTYLRQFGCLIEVTANTGLTVHHYIMYYTRTLHLTHLEYKHGRDSSVNLYDNVFPG